MGLGDFFRPRRERENAIPPSAKAQQPSEARGSFATPEGQPVVGAKVGGGLGSVELGETGGMDGLAALSQLARHGIDPAVGGTGLNFRIEPRDE